MVECAFDKSMVQVQFLKKSLLFIISMAIG